jgi:hypothetical protein
MIIDESEKIDQPKLHEDSVIFTTTTYGDGGDTREKIFKYSLKDNVVYHIETCKIEKDGRDCKTT